MDPPAQSSSPPFKRARKAAKFILASAFAIGLPVALVISSLITQSKIGIWALILMLGVGIPLAILGLAWRSASTGKRMRTRGEDLDLLEVVRGPLRSTSIVRGECERRVVRIFRDRIEVELAAPLPGHLDREGLATLGDPESADSSPYAGTPAARAAGASLAALGVTSVEIGATKVIAHGGTARATVLIPHLVELALAPATIRFAPMTSKECGCPFCKQPIDSVLRSPVVRCPACEAQHHVECWQDHGGCSVFRCRRAPQGERAERAPEAPTPVPKRDTPLVIRVREPT
jgi:hypothetical protein